MEAITQIKESIFGKTDKGKLMEVPEELLTKEYLKECSDEVDQIPIQKGKLKTKKGKYLVFTKDEKELLTKKRSDYKKTCYLSLKKQKEINERNKKLNNKTKYTKKFKSKNLFDFFKNTIDAIPNYITGEEVKKPKMLNKFLENSKALTDLLKHSKYIEKQNVLYLLKHLKIKKIPVGGALVPNLELSTIEKQYLKEVYTEYKYKQFKYKLKIYYWISEIKKYGNNELKQIVSEELQNLDKYKVYKEDMNDKLFENYLNLIIAILNADHFIHDIIDSMREIIQISNTLLSFIRFNYGSSPDELRQQLQQIQRGGLRGLTNQLTQAQLKQLTNKLTQQDRRQMGKQPQQLPQRQRPNYNSTPRRSDFSRDFSNYPQQEQQQQQQQQQQLQRDLDQTPKIRSKIEEKDKKDSDEKRTKESIKLMVLRDQLKIYISTTILTKEINEIYNKILDNLKDLINKRLVKDEYKKESIISSNDLSGINSLREFELDKNRNYITQSEINKLFKVETEDYKDDLIQIIYNSKIIENQFIRYTENIRNKLEIIVNNPKNKNYITPNAEGQYVYEDNIIIDKYRDYKFLHPKFYLNVVEGSGYYQPPVRDLILFNIKGIIDFEKTGNHYHKENNIITKNIRRNNRVYLYIQNSSNRDWNPVYFGLYTKNKFVINNKDFIEINLNRPEEIISSKDLYKLISLYIRNFKNINDTLKHFNTNTIQIDKTQIYNFDLHINTLNRKINTEIQYASRDRTKHSSQYYNFDIRQIRNLPNQQNLLNLNELILAFNIFNKMKEKNRAFSETELKMILLSIQSLFNIQIIMLILDNDSKDKYKVLCDNIQPPNSTNGYKPESTIIIKRITKRITKSDGNFNYELLSYKGNTIFTDTTLPEFMKRLITKTCI
jgi:hypothetical protein